jgi:hypothetical protein
LMWRYPVCLVFLMMLTVVDCYRFRGGTTYESREAAEFISRGKSLVAEGQFTLAVESFKLAAQSEYATDIQKAEAYFLSGYARFLSDAKSDYVFDLVMSRKIFPDSQFTLPNLATEFLSVYNDSCSKILDCSLDIGKPRAVMVAPSGGHVNIHLASCGKIHECEYKTQFSSKPDMAEWVTVSPSRGKTDTTVTVTWQANDSNFSRRGYVIFEPLATVGLPDSFTIYQGACTTPMGACNTSGDAGPVAVSGNYAYVAVYAGGLEIIDVSDPENPIIAGKYTRIKYVDDVAVSGKYVLVAAGSEGMEIVDVSNPTNPKRVGRVDVRGGASSVATTKQYAYVAGKSGDFLIVDISNPARPSCVGKYQGTFSDPCHMVVSRDRAFIADRGAGVLILDVGNPATPQLVATIEGAYCEGVAVLDSLIYISIYDKGLFIYHISNANEVTLVGYVATHGHCKSVAVSGTIALAGGDGISVIDVSNPGLPNVIRKIFTSDTIWDITIAGGVAYAAVMHYAGVLHGGLRIVMPCR